jgi:hypothetical protein
VASNQKILIVISHDLFVRNYLQTKVLEPLMAAFTCSVLASDGVTDKATVEQTPGFAGYFKTDRRIDSFHQALFDLLMWRYRNRSKSFYFRFLRYLRIDLLKQPKGLLGVLRNAISFLAHNIKDPRALRIVMFGNKYLFPLSLKWITKRIPPNADLQRRILELQPDIIAFPSSAYDSVGNDVIRIAKARKMKTLFLIDNWDNLSSKSLFWEKPDFLGVWGEQSKRHAIDIHGFDADAVVKIGTPRFDKYYAVREQSLKSHFDFRYVLFVGCAIPFDETSALRVLESEIRDNPEVYDGARIVYRPHPWRQERIGEENFREENFQHVAIDPQIRQAYFGASASNPSGIGFQPDTNYYPSLLQNALFVVGPLTTMLVESLIFHRKIVALAYDDQIHFTSPHNALKYFVHFEGLDKIRAITFCKDRKNLAEAFREAYEKRREIDKKETDTNLGSYLFSDQLSYGDRLVNLVRQVNTSV